MDHDHLRSRSFPSLPQRRRKHLRALIVFGSVLLAVSVLVLQPVHAVGIHATPTRSSSIPHEIVPPSISTYFKASNTNAGDAFGFRVALDADTLVVSAPYEASAATGINGDQTNNTATRAGAVYVFVRNGTVWSQQAYLKASNTEEWDIFGSSIAIDGDTLVVGAHGEDSAANGINGNQSDNTASNAGAAYVFVRNGTVWSQQAYLKASNTDADDQFGSSSAVDGDTIVIGARGEQSGATGINGNQSDDTASNAGAAYVFVRNGTVWSQQAYLKASNTDAGDQFGYGVAITDHTIAIGANGESSAAIGINGNQSDDTASKAGAAYVFVRNGTVWSQQTYLKASNTDPDDAFGQRLQLSGTTLVVGAHGEDSAASGINGNQSDNTASNAGAAYVFVWSGTTWSQQAYLKASNPDPEDGFGFTMDIMGEWVVIGAPYESSAATTVNGNQRDNSASRSGAAYLFARQNTMWEQHAYLKAMNTDAGDLFGNSVVLDATQIIVGASNEDSDATGINGDHGNNLAPEAGAAYAFALAPIPASVTYLPFALHGE